MTPTLTALVNDLAEGRLRVIDLTQTLGRDTPVIDLPPMFAASPGVTIDEISRYDAKGPAWYWNTLQFGEHTGTHFDAPIHWVTGKDLPNNATNTIPPGRFIGPACVIDVTADVERNPDFLLSVDRLEAWERQHGRIPSGAWVLLRTGWSRRKTKAEFINADATGPHSPGFEAATSRLLAHDRDPPFPNHGIMHGAGKFGLASLCNLDQLPPTGAVVIAAPLKIVNGSGSPLRVLAIAP
jgi:kynurenine formamidase